MARDIYSRQAEYGGSFAADLVKLNFGKLVNAKGAVVQRLVLAYQQAVNRLFEIGSNLFYYVGGRASGEAAMDKILGPGNLMDEFLQTYGDICSPETLQVTLKEGCANVQATESWTCGACVATAVGISVAANDMIVNQNCRLMVGWVTK